MRHLKFHHFIIPIAAAMVAIGLALLAAPRRFGILEILGSDLVLAVANVLIVFGVFSIASYGVVRAVEWVDRYVSHAERKEDERFQ
jgi:hypothetical protein